MLRKKFKNKGFTLIEIIVVIVILAVLMAVAVPSVMSYINEGNKAKYEAIARAAFINTQIAVAKDIANDGKANDFPYVQIWVDGLNSKYQQTAIEKFGSRRSYVGANQNGVYVTEITLSGSATSIDQNVASATFYIRLEGKKTYRKVEVFVNKKITVEDTDIAAPIPNVKNKYTFAK